jgi:hypothetical protein
VVGRWRVFSPAWQVSDYFFLDKKVAKKSRLHKKG